MAAKKLPFARGSRIEFDGRTGTFISFVWDFRYGSDEHDRAWKVVFDDEPETFVRIADEDKPRVRNITPALVEVTARFGRRAYSIELPDGEHIIVKKGAYWFPVAPGQRLPGKNEFQSAGASTTRQGAIDATLGGWAWTASKPAQAAIDARRSSWR